LRDDVEDGALALIFALGVLSFHDARPRGNSHIDYVEGDEWTLDDLVSPLRFWKGALCLDTDYVRGRMMKTHIRVWPTGIVEIDTIGRHQMATRWILLLMGKKAPPPRWRRRPACSMNATGACPGNMVTYRLLLLC
jgi:hypothetical protein